MKTALLSFCLSAIALHASAADTTQPPHGTPKPPRAKITAVSGDSDKRTLVVRYEIAGTVSEERILFAQEIAEFRYCSWVGDCGIAVVARTGVGKTSGYFYSAFFLASGSKDHQPARIPAPEGDSPVLGIGNTHGDSVVITAVAHSRNAGDSVSGWVYIDNCPSTDSGHALGRVTPFAASAESPLPK